jgi:hypothetical protein
VLVLSVAEGVARGVGHAARFPDATTWLGESVARTGEIFSLAPVLFVLDALASVLASARPSRRLAAWVAAAFVRLTQPARSVRLLLVYLVAWLVAARASQTQLPWHSGAVIAGGILGAAALLELLLARLRREPTPERANRIICAAWLFALVVFGTEVASLVGQPLLGATFTALGALAFLRAGLPDLDLRASWVLLFFGAGAAAIAYDAQTPELRRFASAYTPYSALGSFVLEWVTDLDGDGASATFGLDCDDLDGTRAPQAPDLPDNGADENCRNGDGSLQRTVARYAKGGVHVMTGAPPPPPYKPPIFLITVDAWRADSFEDSVFPETRAWARGCIRFTQARSNSNSTGTSLTALHTGMYSRHVVISADQWFIGLAAPALEKMSTPPTLAAALAIAGGYSTTVVFPPFHVPNVQFLTGYESGGSLPDPGGAGFPPASVTLTEARKRFAEAPPDRPVHLRVHLMDLHAPYAQGSGHAGYLRTARALDAVLASYLRSLPKNALVVLTADHGEAFAEHGFITHGHTLFDEELRVPLVLCAPPEFELGPAREVNAAVSSVDVMPTLLELAGVHAPYWRHGESLVPLLRSGTAKRAPWVYFEGTYFAKQGVLLGCDKWIEDAKDGWQALFDVCNDPAETRDLSRIEPARAERMRHLLGEILDLDIDSFRSWRFGQKVLVEFEQ